MYDYMDQEDHTHVAGSFVHDKNADFKQGIKSLFEGLKNAFSIDPMENLSQALKVDAIKESYKERLLGDVLNESFQDEYYQLLPAKMEQLFENSSLEIIRESAVAQLAPIVGISLPILKKNFLESRAKDIVMTEVPSKPIIKVAFERKFLKDKDGAKHYVPDIFYNDQYKQIMAKTKGKAIDATFHEVPTMDLGIMALSGGSLQTRDQLAYDFHIKAVKIKTKTAQGADEVKTIETNITPDMGSNNTFSARVTATGGDGNKVVDMISGQVDFYSGTVSVSVASGAITEVQFGGHLSNENNVETAELDREREVKDWKIPDGARLNTGLTIERIKDYKALLDIDITADLIADMSTILTQMEDSETLGFLDASLERWRGKKDLPFGYSDGFVEEYEFSLTPPANTMVTQSQYIATELPYRLNREIDRLKEKLRTEDIMFVMYAHPDNLTLLQDTVRWVIDEDSKIGGIQLEYKFGVLTGNKNRIHVVTSMKVPRNAGIRTVAYPRSKEVITFKHYKYSFNIENIYRNPFTPLTPNVMATSRYLTTEVLPVQGEFKLTDNDFGRKTQYNR